MPLFQLHPKKNKCYLEKSLVPGLGKSFVYEKILKVSNLSCSSSISLRNRIIISRIEPLFDKYPPILRRKLT
jgi:hypothetical protein